MNLVLSLAVVAALLLGLYPAGHVPVIARTAPPAIALLAPELKDLRTNPASDFRSPYRMITTEITNNEDYDIPLVVFLEIRDTNGLTLYLVYHILEVNASGRSEVGSSWQLPQEQGDYELRTFAISNFTKPEILTGVNMITVNERL